MKKIKISLEDLLVVLEAMRENGTKEVVFMEYNNYPALADADEMESVITFQGVNEKGELVDEDEIVH